jgi:broad specificity phosphatase PhoE
VKETLHPEETITSLLLVRHGHTYATEQGKLYTDPQAELTERGLVQANVLASWIKKEKIEVILSSTAKRVVATAQIIGTTLKVKPILLTNLDEWRIGDWEGRSYLEVKKNDPDVYNAWSKDPIRNKPPGGESVIDLIERSRNELEALLSIYEGKTVVLVTHAGIIRSILVNALGMPVDNFWRISVPVGSLSRIDFSKNFATVQFVSLTPNEH